MSLGGTQNKNRETYVVLNNVVVTNASLTQMQKVCVRACLCVWKGMGRGPPWDAQDSVWVIYIQGPGRSHAPITVFCGVFIVTM